MERISHINLVHITDENIVLQCPWVKSLQFICRFHNMYLIVVGMTFKVPYRVNISYMLYNFKDKKCPKSRCYISKLKWIFVLISNYNEIQGCGYLLWYVYILHSFCWFDDVRSWYRVIGYNAAQSRYLVVISLFAEYISVPYVTPHKYVYKWPVQTIINARQIMNTVYDIWNIL